MGALRALCTKHKEISKLSQKGIEIFLTAETMAFFERRDINTEFFTTNPPTCHSGVENLKQLAKNRNIKESLHI